MSNEILNTKKDFLLTKSITELQENPNFPAYENDLKKQFSEFNNGKLTFDDYSKIIKKTTEIHLPHLKGSHARDGISERSEETIHPPYNNGSAGSFTFGLTQGDNGQWPDPSNGVCHSLVVLDHSDATSVRVCAINIPVTNPELQIDTIDLSITYDMFSWATKNPPVKASFWVWVEGGTNGSDGFPLDGFNYPCPYGGYTGFEDPLSMLNPVFPSGNYGHYPYWNSYWWYSFSKTIPDQIVPTNASQTFQTTINARSWKQGVRLWVVAKAIGGNPKHSGGGVRIIASIDQVKMSTWNV